MEALFGGAAAGGHALVPSVNGPIFREWADSSGSIHLSIS